MNGLMRKILQLSGRRGGRANTINSITRKFPRDKDYNKTLSLRREISLLFPNAEVAVHTNSKLKNFGIWIWFLACLIGVGGYCFAQDTNYPSYNDPEYDPVTDTWRTRADMPKHGKVDPENLSCQSIGMY